VQEVVHYVAEVFYLLAGEVAQGGRSWLPEKTVHQRPRKTKNPAKNGLVFLPALLDTSGNESRRLFRYLFGCCLKLNGGATTSCHAHLSMLTLDAFFNDLDGAVLDRELYGHDTVKPRDQNLAEKAVQNAPELGQL